MGRPMATTDPKAMSMMSMAARMPAPSAGPPGLADTTAEMGAPPRATATPGRAAPSAVLMTRCTAALGRVSACRSNCTVA